MTVVAWDGKTLAVDRQATSGGLISEHTKIIKLKDGEVLAFWGHINEYALITSWYVNGAIESEFPKLSDQIGMLVVSPDGAAVEYEANPAPIEIEVPFYAWAKEESLLLGLWLLEQMQFKLCALPISIAPTAAAALTRGT